VDRIVEGLAVKGSISGWFLIGILRGNEDTYMHIGLKNSWGGSEGIPCLCKMKM
jgi:hypothetical protein